MSTIRDLLDRPPMAHEGHPIGVDDWRIVARLAIPSLTESALWGVAEWGDGEWSEVPLQDITRYARGMTWTRGGLAERPQVGSGTITLDNTAYRFSPVDPSNSLGQIVHVDDGAVENFFYGPGTAVQIVAFSPAIIDTQPAVGFVPQVTGLVESWTEVRNSKDRESYVDVNFVETLASLARVNENALASLEGNDDTASQRIERLADAAGWEYGVSVHTDSWAWDTYPLQSTDMAQNRQAEIYLTADSVGAVARTGRDGTIVVYDRPPAVGPVAEPVLLFSETLALAGYDPSEILDGQTWYQPVRALADVVVWDNDNLPIVNSVELARAGGTAQLAQDTDSIARHRKATYTRHDLINKSDTLTLALAHAKLETNTLRLRSADLDTLADPTAALVILSVDVGNQIQTWHETHDHQGVLINTALVDQLEHSITPIRPDLPVRWSCRYALGRQTSFTYELLDNL